MWNLVLEGLVLEGLEIWVGSCCGGSVEPYENKEEEVNLPTFRLNLLGKSVSQHSASVVDSKVVGGSKTCLTERACLCYRTGSEPGNKTNEHPLNKGGCGVYTTQ